MRLSRLHNLMVLRSGSFVEEDCVKSLKRLPCLECHHIFIKGVSMQPQKWE